MQQPGQTPSSELPPARSRKFACGWCRERPYQRPLLWANSTTGLRCAPLIATRERGIPAAVGDDTKREIRMRVNGER